MLKKAPVANGWGFFFFAVGHMLIAFSQEVCPGFSLKGRGFSRGPSKKQQKRQQIARRKSDLKHKESKIPTLSLGGKG
jgi:hypothetical protein